jgi:hypothetical protein
MLNNILNLFNLIKIGSLRQTLESSDLFMLGVKNGRYDGDYRPAIITVQDLIAYINSNVANVGGLFSQTVDGPTVTNTTVESSILGTGVGSLSVPAGAFKVGDSFHITVIGHLSSKNNDDLRIRVKSGSVVLVDTGNINMPGLTNQHFELNIDFTIRAVGAAGVASIASGGQLTYIKDASTAFEGVDFSVINNTTFDTTVLNTLTITAQWNAANSLNSIYTEIVTLTKTY